MTIQTKLNAKQEAWFLHENKVTSAFVDKIEVAAYRRDGALEDSIYITYVFKIETPYRKEHEILRVDEEGAFASKKELIDSL